jgi:Neuraminidase (sialidase)
VPLEDPYRAVMPAVSRLKDGSIVAALRRRDPTARASAGWIAYGSRDNGRTWTFLSRVGETGKENGNPPALVALADGRLACAYGDRSRVKMFARLSSDGGKTWDGEVVLRDDFQPDKFGDKDFGYPRLAVNHENQIVALYYWATKDQPQHHIAATLWNPERP